MEEMQNLHAVRKLPLSIRSSQLSTEASIEVTFFFLDTCSRHWL